MNEGMPEDIGFNCREINPEKILGEDLNLDNFKAGFGLRGLNFEKVADVVANKEKLMDVTDFNESAVAFQQDIIKDILAIKENNPKKAAEEAEKYWEEYDNMVRGYAGRFKNESERKKIIIEFGFYKTSIIGSLAVIRFFEEKGFKVKFPTAKEDIFNQCDLLFEKFGSKKNDFNLGVQLKSYHSEAVNSKEGAKRVKRIFSIDRSMISDKKYQDSFSKLQSHCVELNNETGKTYFPIFMEMPISVDVFKPGNNESNKVSLVDNRGFFKLGQLKPSMDTLWRGYNKVLTDRNK